MSIPWYRQASPSNVAAALRMYREDVATGDYEPSPEEADYWREVEDYLNETSGE